MRLAGQLIATFVVSTVAVAATPLFANPALPVSEDVYLWTCQFRSGDREQISVHSEISGLFHDKSLTAHVDQTSVGVVRAVSVVGDATIVENTTSSITSFSGKTYKEDISARAPVDLVRSKKGLVVKDDPHSYDAYMSQPLYLMLRETPVPDTAVPIGGSWHSQISNRFLSGERVALTSTLVGKVRAAGTDVLEVGVKFSVPVHRSASRVDMIQVSGTYRVDPLSGRTVHSEYSVTGYSFQGSSAVATLKVISDYSLLAGSANGGQPR